MKYILDRLKEASTWRGVIMVIGGAFGFTLAPELTDSIVAIAVAVMGSGVIGALIPDTK